MVTVRFDAHGALTLDADTRAQLCAAFNRDWADVGYQLMAIGECLLLAGPTLSGTRSVDPTPFAGRWVEEARLDVGEGQGEGEVAGAKALWRLMTELQMWLHDLRLAAGDGRVLNALWLWGQGDGTVGGRAVWPRLMVEDPLLKVLAGVDPGPRQDAVLTEWSLAALARQGEAFAASDASWWGPLLADLQQARYATARVYIDGHEYECRAPRWWSRWRRRPWWQVLA